ncbi:bifunctional precorrin-2 dehydrogenase/sirohydrochlorin ferrochelatase [soil metagenome]
MHTDGAIRGVPVLVQTRRVRVLCVGGGTVASRKIAGLIAGGAAVRVVAPVLSDPLTDAEAAGAVAWEARTYRHGDIGDAHLVVAATDDPAVNAEVADAADAAGRLCVRVDDGAQGSIAMMAAVHRDPLVLAVATTTGAPSLARVLRAELADAYGPEYGELAALCTGLRADVRVTVALANLSIDERRARWRALTRPDILDLIRAGHLDEAKEAALACLLSSSD